MALEKAGNSDSLKKLVRRIKKKFPDYNFDVVPEPDRKHKAPSLCKSNTINYTDTEGNLFCGQRFKLVNDSGVGYTWTTCHALIRKVDEQKKYQDLQDEIF
tara:strand:+ start:393 stop:695 length:303 start_codon:yes stop_codon:yes gene_type:complete